jgi:cold shock CspA family protein
LSDSIRYRGTVRRWEANCQYGFISADADAASVFIGGVSVRRSGLSCLQVGDVVDYAIAEAIKGGTEAVDIVLVKQAGSL